MARKNYIERQGDTVAAGNAPTKEEELVELDRADVQEKILNPPTIDVTRLDGRVIHCKSKFGPADFKKRKVMDSLGTLFSLLLNETVKLSCDTNLQDGDGAWIQRNAPYLDLAAKRFNVQVITCECIAGLGNTVAGVDDFDPEELKIAALSFFGLYITEKNAAEGAAKASGPKPKRATVKPTAS